MNSLAVRLLSTTTLFLTTCVASNAMASHYEWIEDTPAAYQQPDSQRDPVTIDSLGRLILLTGDGHSNNFTQVRSPEGSWRGELPNTIPWDFVLNELATNPNTGRAIALGAEPEPDDDNPDTPSTFQVVGYEYIGTNWVRTVYANGAESNITAFDFDESGALHMLYMGFATGKLQYARHAGGSTTNHPVTSLLGSNYSQLEIQASSDGTAPVFASAYAPDGFVFAAVSNDDGATWGGTRVIDYGFTGTTYGIQQFASLMDDAQRVHLFYVIDNSGFLRVRHRVMYEAGGTSTASDLDFGPYGWHVLLHNGQPHYVHRAYRDLGGYVLRVDHYSEGSWETQQPRYGEAYGQCHGAASFSGYLFVLASENSGDKRLFIGIEAPMFSDGFE